MLGKIDQFEVAARDGAIFYRSRKAELSKIERSIQKELFAAANAAHSLIDHSTRRLNAVAKLPNYRNRINECFGADGLPEFVVETRNALHHINMVEAGWEISREFQASADVATFKVKTQVLAEAIADSPKVKRDSEAREKVNKFLELAADKIDIRAVFNEYRQRAREFHEWLSSEMTATTLIELHDYEACILENRRFSTRLQYRAIILYFLQLPNPLDVYDRLPEYLTEPELEIVRSLQHGSRAQIDKIIEFVDDDRACDDELRHLIYELFDRISSPPVAKQP